MKEKDKEDMVEQQMEQGAETMQEAPVEQQAAEPASNPFADRLKKRYPDKEFTSDDEVSGALTEYLDELEGYQTSTEEANQKLTQVLQEVPELVGIIRDVSQGATITEALSRNIDIDEIKPMEGDPDYEAWNNNIESRKQTKAEREAKSQMYKENLDMSVAEIKAFQEENGMTPEDTSKFLNTLNEFIGEVVDGKLTKTTLARMKKALDYDMDVEMAAKNGEVAGKNAKIDAVKEKSKKKTDGDGLPAITGQGATAEAQPKKEKTDWEKAMEEEKSRRKLI